MCLRVLRSKVATMPTQTANRITKVITAYLWNNKPPTVRKNFLYLAGLSLPNVKNIAHILSTKTVQVLTDNTKYIGRPLLIYWLSTLRKTFITEPYIGPVAEKPLPFL